MASGTVSGITWTLDESTGALTIGMVTGTAIPKYFGGSSETSNPLYAYRTQIKSLTIGSGIRDIGEGAFLNCLPNVTSVSIPSTVNSIGYRAFEGGGMSSFSLPTNLTSLGRRAFYNCTKLSYVRISTRINTLPESAFAYCTSLKSVSIPVSITEIHSDCFRGSGLETLTLTKGIRTIGDNAFRSCVNLTSITFETTSAPTLGSGSFYLHDDSSAPAVKMRTNGGWGSDSIFTTTVRGPYVKFIYSPIEYSVIFKNNYDGTVTALVGGPSTPITVPTPASRDYYTFNGWVSGYTVLSPGDTYYPSDDVEFTDSWTGITFNVTFIHRTGITTSQTVQGGTSITLPSGRTDWSDSEHYTESGWYSGTTLIGKSGVSYKVTKAIELTMKWTPKEYTVTFRSSETSYTKALKGTIESPVTAPSVSREYYTFNGWVSGSTTVKAGSTYTPTSNITFNASWTGVSYTLTFVHYTGITTTQKAQGGTSVTLPTARTDWTDSQYFKESGWNPASSPTTYLQSGASYKVTRNETLTMKWVGRNYTVSFVTAGGTAPSPITYTYSEGVTITLPNAITNYKDNTFVSWETGGFEYKANASYQPKGDVTFTAVWKLNRYTVTYSSTVANVTLPESVTADAGTQITLGTPTRAHYDCTGWYKGESTGDKVGNTGAKYTVSGNITLYPRWTPTKYTVSFSVPSTVGSVADLVGTVESPVQLPNVSGGVTDKSFIGWSVKSDGSGTVYPVNYAYYPQSDIVLYAVFEANAVIRLYRNYSSSDNTVIRTYSVRKGTKITLANYPSTDYYYCTGWYNARSNGTRIGGQGDDYTTSASIDLYAHWQNCPTVTFDANGGTVNGSSAIAVRTTGQTSFQIKDTDYPTDPVWEHHVFDGWYDTYGKRYDANSVYTQSITIQARWTEIRISEIRVSVNGQTGEAILSEAGIISEAKADIISTVSGIQPDLSNLVWTVSNPQALYKIEGTDPTVIKVVPLDVSGSVTVVLTCSVTYPDRTVSGTIRLTLTQQIYLTLLNDHATEESERIISIPIDNQTYLPTSFPSIPSREGYEFNAWLDTSTDALITKDTQIFYNRRARAHWFRVYDQWDKDNLIIQLYNNEGTAIVKQFAMGTVTSLSKSYRVSPTAIPTPMQTSESTFLIDTAVTMTMDVECVRANPVLKEGESFDDEGEDYNYWTNRKWIDELMALVDRWQGQSDGIKVLYIPNDCKPHDLKEGTVTYGELYPLFGSLSEDRTGFCYKGNFYRGKNAYITSFSRKIDQTSPEETHVTLGFAIGGLKSRYV